MTDLKIQEHDKKYVKKNIPVLRPGYQVRVHQKIKEGSKERIQVFEGLVLAIRGAEGPNKTITVRKVVEGIGVEKIFPLYSPNIAKIEVKKTFGVRRAKLFFLREHTSLSKRLRAKLGLTNKDVAVAEARGGDEEVVAEPGEVPAGPANAEVKEEAIVPEAEAPKEEVAQEEAQAPKAAAAPEAEPTVKEAEPEAAAPAEEKAEEKSE